MTTNFLDDPVLSSNTCEIKKDLLTCKICSCEFSDNKSFNRHLRPTHGLLLVEYFQQNWPRHDLFDNSIIKFKSQEQYFSTDFNSKTNLKRYLTRLTPEAAKDYCRKLLLNRKHKKKAKYTPAQVELRTILSPSIIYLEELFKKDGGYYKLCEDLGFESRFSPLDEKQFVDVECKDLSKFKIIVDSREQKPLKFNFATETQGLKFGDYSFNFPGYSGNTVFERKSLSDLIGTLSIGYERFQREIERAQEARYNLIILVENDLNTCLSFNYLPHIKRHTKLTPDFIFHNVRELCQKYQNIQFLFVNDRKEASRVIEKIFMLPGLTQNFDLQLAYDKKLL